MFDDEETPKRHEPWAPVFIAFSVFGFALLLLLRPVFTIIQTVVDYTLKHGINGGLATLLGAVIGFSALARQANIGFKNLSYSQANQAKLDREAREHQKLIESENKIISLKTERKALAAALSGELSSMISELDYMSSMLNIHKERILSKQVKIGSNYSFTGINQPNNFVVYHANVDKLGLFIPSTVNLIVSMYNSISKKLPLPDTIADKNLAVKILETNIDTIEYKKQTLLTSIKTLDLIYNSE